MPLQVQQVGADRYVDPFQRARVCNGDPVDVVQIRRRRLGTGVVQDDGNDALARIAGTLELLADFARLQRLAGHGKEKDVASLDRRNDLVAPERRFRKGGFVAPDLVPALDEPPLQLRHRGHVDP